MDLASIANSMMRTGIQIKPPQNQRTVRLRESRRRPTQRRHGTRREVVGSREDNALVADRLL